jgi:hypothetical protein
MNYRTTALAGTFAIISLAGVARAQTASRPRIAIIAVAPTPTTQAPVPQPQYQPPATAQYYQQQQQSASRYSGRARIGLIVPPPAVVPQQNGFPTAGFANGAPRVAAFYYLPAVVLTDGRVFANFNGTFEQVLRRCPITSGPVPPGFATPACWIVDSYGRYQVIQGR